VPADGGIRFGPYVLIRRLARGGMAEVFLAQQRGLEGFDRRVAVKRILPHLADNPDFVKMFLGEAKLAAQLSHPNIVHIYDFGKVDHDYFIAMEFVDGIHAGEIFKSAEKQREMKMSPTLIARIGADAAAALHYAHELMGPNGKPLELVHRDVSPANIMISYDGVVKLCDFGIAKAMSASDQLTNPGQVKGKYAYMSPEQTIAAPLDGRSDVFSLGICLWELLAGKTIVPRGDAVDSMRMIRDGKLQPISQIAPATPPPLAKAINWALQTKREQRATAAELASALEAFIKASPEIATSMQLAQWVRTRFPRELSGQHPRLTETPGQGTNAAPGTSVAPGTVGGTQSRKIDAVTPSANLIAASRISDPGDPDTAETVALLSSSDLQGISSEERDNAAVLEELAHDLQNRPTSPRGINVRASDLAAHPTVISGPPIRPSDASMRAADEATVRDRTETIMVADADSEETKFTSGAFRPQVPSGPTVVPTRLQHAIERRPATPVPTDSMARQRARRFLLPAAILTGIAVLTFLIALAARKSPDPPEAPRDAGITVTPIDTRAVNADSPPDTTPTPDTTPPPDAPQPTALLVLRTTPEGATVKVGDQTRKAPAELALPDGDYTVIAEAEGFQPETRKVSLLRDERVVLEIVLTKRIVGPRPAALGKLVVATTPYSDVFNGTRKLGQTPFEMDIAVGTYTLTFKNPDRPVATRKVTITAGKPTRLKFDLPK
jgi:serine/threonine protein kinase